jgi:hypothetical protein
MGTPMWIEILARVQARIRWHQHGGQAQAALHPPERHNRDHRPPVGQCATERLANPSLLIRDGIGRVGRRQAENVVG